MEWIRANKRICTVAVLGVLAVIGMIFDQGFWSSLDDRVQRDYITGAQNMCMLRQGFLPEKPFTTDGCSFFPNGPWTQCCVEHDYTYWCGGERSQRMAMDKALLSCVNDVTPGLGWVLFTGSRLSGIPEFPFGFRWGNGHSWPDYK